MNTSLAIIEKVADAEDADPLDLPPLRDSIDPEALDRCAVSMSGASTIKFEYNGYDVTVTGDEGVSISRDDVDGSPGDVAGVYEH